MRALQAENGHDDVACSASSTEKTFRAIKQVDTALSCSVLTRKDFQVGANVAGLGLDDPDPVFYAPGEASTRHRHRGPVFAYIVSGAIVSRFGMEPPVTYGEGEMWYESPGAVHSTSRNASETDLAKLITVFAADQRQMLTEPISW